MNNDIHPCANDQLNGIRQRLREEQEHDRWHHSEETVIATLVRVLDHKRSHVASTIARSRDFQQDVLTFLRAFSLMLETVSGASTHAEKAARLRGLIELVETAATRVRERQFREQESWSYSMADDVFRCDYPVRHWIHKCREAEAKQQAAEEELKKVREIYASAPSV